MAESAAQTVGDAGAEPAQSSSAFTVHERKETDRAVFVYTTYNGDAGPQAPPPLPAPPVLVRDDGNEAVGHSGASALNSVFVMANSTVGAGVLSLPFAFQATGIIGGLILCAAVGVTEALTLYVLSKFAERYSAGNYVELVRRALGRKLAVVLSGVLVVAMFGACVAYLIIIADNLSSFKDVLHLPEWAGNRHVITAVLGGAVLLPMSLPRQMGALARMNQVAVLGFLVGAALVAYQGVQTALKREDLMDGVELFNFDYRTLAAIPIVVFGFNCHAMVVSIFYELESQPGLLVPIPSSPSAFRRFRYIPRPSSRKLVGMLGVIMTSTGLILVVYVIVGISGYLAFPRDISSNILQSFPQDDPLLQVARVMITLIVLGSYPLTHHPARAGFEHLVKPAGATTGSLTFTDPNSPPPGVPIWLSVAFTFAFVLGSTAVAEVVTDLGKVLNLLGGLCVSFVIFFLPGLLLINAAIVKHSTRVLKELEQQGGVGQVQGDEEASASSVPAGADGLREPLLLRLQSAKDKGIKKSGLIYAPRLSWVFGTLLMATSIAVGSIALLTAIRGSR